MNQKEKVKRPSLKKITTYEFETQPEDDLPAPIRSYAKGLREYSAIVQRIRQNIGLTKFVTPIVSWLDEIDSILVEPKEIIQGAIDNDRYTDIRERLVFEGESFLSILSAKPSPPNLSGATDQDELTVEQVVDYFEDLCDRIGGELLVVYYYLIGAKF